MAKALMSTHILRKILNPPYMKSIKHIGLELLGTVNRAVPF